MAKFVLIIALLTGAFALANPRRIHNPCGTVSCSSNSLQRTTLSEEEFSSLEPDFRALLQRKADEFSNLWADTILEGDYYADGEVRVESLDQIFKSQQLIAYRITYSAKAWDTSSCAFDPDDLESLASCESGRIVESGFISADFKELDRDPEALAVFKKD